jgi:hypothetical protein
MPTFAQRITPFDRRVAACASESGTLYGTHLSLRVGHRSERVSHRSKGLVHGSAFVGMLSEDLDDAETGAGMSFERRALRSPLLSHADVFVTMRDAIGAMQDEHTSDAPRRARALPRARRTSLRAAGATIRMPRDASCSTLISWGATVRPQRHRNPMGHFFRAHAGNRANPRFVETSCSD